MTDCARCGKCCEYLAIAQERDIPKDSRKYMEYHGAFFDKGFALIRAPCKHLAFHEMNKASCLIEKDKPLQCRQFKGKKLHDGRISYIPEGCRMAIK
jgi:hypothetical protein